MSSGPEARSTVKQNTPPDASTRAAPLASLALLPLWASCGAPDAAPVQRSSAVVAKPPGTETPRPDNSPIISPSEEFLPPTWARSDRRRSCSQRTLLVKAGSVGQGGAWALEVRYFTSPA